MVFHEALKVDIHQQCMVSPSVLKHDWLGNASSRFIPTKWGIVQQNRDDKREMLLALDQATGTYSVATEPSGEVPKSGTGVGFTGKYAF